MSATMNNEWTTHANSYRLKTIERRTKNWKRGVVYVYSDFSFFDTDIDETRSIYIYVWALGATVWDIIE
jgi:hypothetical protein